MAKFAHSFGIAIGKNILVILEKELNRLFHPIGEPVDAKCKTLSENDAISTLAL